MGVEQQVDQVVRGKKGWQDAAAGLGADAVPALLDAIAAQAEPGERLQRAIEALVRVGDEGTIAIVLGRLDADREFDPTFEALIAFGERALEPTLAAYEAASDDESRRLYRAALSQLGVQDDRIRAILERSLEDDPLYAVSGIVDYGDPDMVPALKACMEALPLRPNPTLEEIYPLTALGVAIDLLGGELEPTQRRKIDVAWALVRRSQDGAREEEVDQKMAIARAVLPHWRR